MHSTLYLETSWAMYPSSLLSGVDRYENSFGSTFLAKSAVSTIGLQTPI